MMEGNRSPVSVGFRGRIVGQDSVHCIPSSFVLRKLELSNFQELMNTPHLVNIEEYLKRVSSDLEQHEMLDYLKDKQLDILQDSMTTFLAFRDTVIPKMKEVPFYLGVDRTYMQEINENSEITIDNFKEYCLKWIKMTQNGRKSFLKIYKEQDLVIIGQAKQDHREFKGIKLYTSQKLRRVEIGNWKQTIPIKILDLTYRKSDGRIEIYYRQFTGRKLLYGQIRSIENDALTIYRQQNQPNP